MSNRLFGSPVISLTELVQQFNIEQGNDTQNHFVSNMVRAKNAYKELLKDTIWSMRLKAIQVNKADNSIVLPHDMLRLINLNVVDDCGNTKPLGFNPDMNTLKLNCPTTCGCDACKGQGTLCDALDYISVITESVFLYDREFIKRTWIKKCEDGTIEKLIEIPEWTPGREPTVMEVRELVCKLDVDCNNCIKKTKENMQMLKEHCGCYIPSWQSRMCCDDQNFPTSNYGYWNWEANARDKIFLKSVKADYLIVAYQCSGEDCNGDEIMIPEYARDLMYYAIVHRQRAWSPIFSRADKEAARIDYTRAKTALFAFLHPLTLEALNQSQDEIPLW